MEAVREDLLEYCTNNRSLWNAYIRRRYFNETFPSTCRSKIFEILETSLKVKIFILFVFFIKIFQYEARKYGVENVVFFVNYVPKNDQMGSFELEWIWRLDVDSIFLKSTILDGYCNRMSDFHTDNLKAGPIPDDVSILLFFFFLFII